MATAYFITASLLFVWMYRHTRQTARSIRVNRERLEKLVD